jgi:hypothetical protein
MSPEEELHMMIFGYLVTGFFKSVRGKNERQFHGARAIIAPMNEMFNNPYKSEVCVAVGEN